MVHVPQLARVHGQVQHELRARSGRAARRPRRLRRLRLRCRRCARQHHCRARRLHTASRAASRAAAPPLVAGRACGLRGRLQAQRRRAELDREVQRARKGLRVLGRAAGHAPPAEAQRLVIAADGLASKSVSRSVSGVFF
eukprot:scaffold114116_cov47-Phaeocystis_antarctica.AAC.1